MELLVHILTDYTNTLTLTVMHITQRAGKPRNKSGMVHVLKTSVRNIR
jgi:hypothetical protein